MHSWNILLIYTVFILLLSNAALALESSAAAIISDEPAYLAPLVEGCHAGDSTCERIEDKYMVTLRDGYDPSSHLAYIAEHIHFDPVKDWKIRWSGDEAYTINNVSAESVDLLRRDPGVVEIEEMYLILMVELDQCRNPHYSEEQRKRCYEKKDLPPCERPDLSVDERRACYDATLLDPCENPMLTEDEKQACLETESLDPCKNPELSQDQKWSCRLNKLVDPCNNPPLSEREERMCAGIPRKGDSKAFRHGEL